MTASVGVTSGTAVRPAPNVSSIMPPASAISALKRVSSIAATEPNTSVRTITATAIPISSPTGASCCSAVSTTGPRIATWSPSPSATLCRAHEALRVLLLDVGCRAVVLDGREGDLAVLGDLGAADRGHLGKLGDLAPGLGDGV